MTYVSLTVDLTPADLPHMLRFQKRLLSLDFQSQLHPWLMLVREHFLVPVMRSIVREGRKAMGALKLLTLIDTPVWDFEFFNLLKKNRLT
jgi:hypothetical protein